MTVTVTDEDLAEFIDPSPHGPKGCVVGRALHALDPDRADLLRRAMGHPDALHSKIEEKMRSWDLRPYNGAVARHRKGECRCQEHGYV